MLSYFSQGMDLGIFVVYYVIAVMREFKQVSYSRAINEYEGFFSMHIIHITVAA